MVKVIKRLKNNWDKGYDAGYVAGFKEAERVIQQYYMQIIYKRFRKED